MNESRHDDAIWHPYTVFRADPPIKITSAKGVYLETHDGRRILDGISSWWVNLHGHSNPVIAKAIARQASELEHVIFAGFTHQPAIDLANNLLKILPGDQRKIFFSDNGSTAVEVAIKMTLQYWHNQGFEKKKFVAIKGAYHGDTFGSMSVAERGLFTRPFHSHLFETIFIDFPDGNNDQEVFRQFEQALTQNDVAGFIFEPLIQAASGMKVYSAQMLDSLMSMARQAKIVTIADEVFTGFGRTGKNFASDTLLEKPDIIALSKGITGGFIPFGVTSCSAKIYDAFKSSELEKTFFHGHSYTGNPIACAAANASLEILLSDECQSAITRISESHADFVRQLKSFKEVTDPRSIGTILAMELRTLSESNYGNPARVSIYNYFLEKNILLRPLGNTIYIVPPYVIKTDELRYIYEAIERFLKK